MSLILYSKKFQLKSYFSLLFVNTVIASLIQQPCLKYPLCFPVWFCLIWFEDTHTARHWDMARHWVQKKSKKDKVACAYSSTIEFGIEAESSNETPLSNNNERDIGLQRKNGDICRLKCSQNWFWQFIIHSCFAWLFRDRY